MAWTESTDDYVCRIRVSLTFWGNGLFTAQPGFPQHRLRGRWPTEASYQMPTGVLDSPNIAMFYQRTFFGALFTHITND